MSGWTGHSGFYLFRCESCGEVCIDYPHGYTDFGLMFLRCDHCRETLTLEVTEERSVYEREKVFIPKETRDERIRDLNEVLAGVEDKGVRVIIPESVHHRRVEAFSVNVWAVGLFILLTITAFIFLSRVLS